MGSLLGEYMANIQRDAPIDIAARPLALVAHPEINELVGLITGDEFDTHPFNEGYG